MKTIEDLLCAFLDTEPAARARQLDELCRHHPAYADELRRMVADLDALGFLAPRDDADAARVGVPQTIGVYRIEAVLGRGGMGLVFRARQTNLGDRPVALKMIRRDLVADGRAEARFVREALLASRLDHPNLCPVIDVGRHESGQYIVMPLIEGRTLAQELAAARQRGDSTVSVADRRPQRDSAMWVPVVAMVEKLARGLHAAHETGLVHRDVKPGNVIVRPNGEPVLLDFGLARSSDDEDVGLTATGEMVGTPAYMAPEQVAPRGRRADARTDVHALGVLLYECLTLHLPYPAATREAVVRQITDEEPLDTRRLNRALPRELATVVQVALEKDPARRFASAADLADDLQRLLRGQPILSRRPGATVRLGRWIQRNPWPTVAGAALAVGLATTSWLLFRLADEAANSRSLALVGASQTAAERDLTLDLALAREAYQLVDRPETFDRLQHAVREMREVAIVTEFGSELLAVEFAADGTALIAVGADGLLLVTDQEGNVLHRAALGIAVDVAVPFEHDGALGCVAACRDGHIRIWAPLHDPALRTVAAEFEPVPAQALFADRGARSTDGRRVLLGTVHGDGVVVGIPEGTVESEVRLTVEGRAVAVLACCFVADDGLLLGGVDGTVCWWRRGAEEPAATFRDPGGRPVLRLAVSGDGQCAVVANRHDAELRVCDLAAGSTALVRDGVLPPTDLIGLPDADEFVVGSVDGTLARWRFGEDRPRRAWVAHRNGIAALACSGGRILSGSEDYTARLWDRDGRQLINLPGHSERVRAVAIDPRGERLATGSTDHRLRIWRVAAPIPALQHPFAGLETFVRFCFDPDGQGVWIADVLTGQIWRGDLLTGAVEPLADTASEGGAYQIDLDRAGEKLLVARRRAVELFETGTGRRLDRLTLPSNSIGAGLTDDGRTAVVVVQGGMLRPPRLGVWDVADGRFVARHDPVPLDVWQQAVAYLVSADLAPDNATVTLARADGTVRLYDLDGQARGEPLDHSVASSLPAQRATLSRSGDMLLTTGLDGVVKLWRRASGGTWQPRILTSFDARARNAYFDPEERRVVVGSDEGLLRVLDLEGRILREFTRWGIPIYQARFSPDGRRVVATTGDGRLMQWLLERSELLDVARSLQIRDLSANERAAYADLLEPGPERRTREDMPPQRR